MFECVSLVGSGWNVGVSAYRQRKAGPKVKRIKKFACEIVSGFKASIPLCPSEEDVLI